MLHPHYGMIILFIQLFCHAQFSNANNLLTTNEKPSTKAQENKYSNFIVDLPYVTTTEVIQQINEMRSSLNKRKAALSKTEKERSFTIKDSAIALIMPGGLLYAAAIKLRHNDAKKQLHNVTEQLNELNQDLIEFRFISMNNTLMAALH